VSEKKVSLIFGKRGSGKSYLCKKLIDREPRLLIYDTMGEYTQGVVFGKEHWETGLDFWLKHYRQNFRLIYRPLVPDAEIEPIAELVFECGNICFVVEEIECYCSSFQISEKFAAIVQRGRHKNITLIGISQRPYGINRLLTSQAEEIYVFNTNEPRDRDYLRSLLGQEIEPKLDQLQQYEHIYWQDGQDQLEIRKA